MWDGIERDDRDVLVEFSQWLDEEVATASSRDADALQRVRDKLDELWPD